MNKPNTDINGAKQPPSEGCMARLVRLPVVKWKMGRLREQAGEGWTSPLVWWVRETEAKQKLREVEIENQRLRCLIKRASTKFCEEGSDGEITTMENQHEAGPDCPLTTCSQSFCDPKTTIKKRVNRAIEKPNNPAMGRTTPDQK